MKPKWLFEENALDQEEVDRMISSVEKLGFEYKLVNFQDFWLLNKLDPYSNNDKECVIFWGSIQLAKFIRAKKNWIPGTFFNLDDLKCSEYYSKYYKYLLNTPYLLCNFGSLKYQRKAILPYVIDEKVFIRPDRGDKVFQANLMEIDSYYNFDNKQFEIISVENEKNNEEEIFYEDSAIYHKFSLLDQYQEINGIKNSEIVLISSPRNIKIEYRVFVVDKKAITGSFYEKRNKKILTGELPAGILDYAQKILDEVKWTPDDAFTLDLCEIDTGEIKVLEFNSFSASGIYASNTDLIVESASLLAEKKYKEYHEYPKVNS